MQLLVLMGQTPRASCLQSLTRHNYSSDKLHILICTLSYKYHTHHWDLNMILTSWHDYSEALTLCKSQIFIAHSRLNMYHWWGSLIQLKDKYKKRDWQWHILSVGLGQGSNFIGQGALQFLPWKTFRSWGEWGHHGNSNDCRGAPRQI